MVVWVALEEVQQLMRVDSIVSVAAVPVRDRIDPRWEKTHPAKRLTEARSAQILLVSSGGASGCALTCEGRFASGILAALIEVLAEVQVRDHGRVRYLRGVPGARPIPPRGVWELLDELPDPDWAR